MGEKGINDALGIQVGWGVQKFKHPLGLPRMKLIHSKPSAKANLSNADSIIIIIIIIII
jgi:hypothetical protein